ncbi:MAG: SET domain-containing protein-lysine N-methyltransferase [Candidatus Omnitrophica bacterium]|nr:SET domain-containing protein-lysine N-methyltransferase [Candidatus Omnitrophota bacterium]
MTNSYILKKKSSIHGYGIFAKTFIPKGTRIIEYVGEKITKAESNRRGPKLVAYAKNHKEQGAVYLFVLNSRYDIDGHVSYNTAKYINHSCKPNCEVDIIKGHIWIIALRDIQKGEELYYNYGYDDITEYEDHPCYCKTDRCIGYILAEDSWPKLKRYLAKKKEA